MFKLAGCFVGLILGLTIFGCHGSYQLPEVNEEFVPPSMLENHAQVIVTDVPPARLPGHGANVIEAVVSGDFLIITVRYSGGSVEHDYSCYVDPGTFSDWSPEQAELYIRDNAPQDVGLMIITETAIFDLMNVADLYSARYDYSAPMELKIYYSGKRPAAKPFTVIYDPR